MAKTLGWSARTKQEVAGTLGNFWPLSFRRDGKAEPELVRAYIEVLEQFDVREVLRVLRETKQNETEDRAPKVAVLRKALESASSGPCRPEFPEDAIGVSVDVRGSRWEATRYGAIGPDGNWWAIAPPAKTWTAKGPATTGSVPEDVYQAILGETDRRAREGVPEYSQEQAAENDELWRGRVDHPDPELAQFYRTLRGKMRAGRFFTDSVSVHRREPGED